MFFITYSQNILFIVLAICVLWLTVVITMFMYYLILAAKEIHTASSIVQKQVEEIEKWIKRLKRNFGVGLAVVGLIKEAAGSAKDFFSNWQEKNSAKKEDIFETFDTDNEDE